MKYQKIYGILTAVTLCIVASSCRHKDLYMEEELSQKVYVLFDWRNAPEANPASMAFYLYESDYTQPQRYIFSGNKGGEIHIPFGRHHSLCIDGDNVSWAHISKQETLGTFELSTLDSEGLKALGISTEGIPRAKGSEDERIATTPGMAWGDTHLEISIVPHNGNDTITLYPEELVCHYTVDIYEVENLEGVATTNIDATLSGMAEAVNVSDNAGTDTQVSMSFQLETNSTEKSLHGDFLTFGESEHVSAPHYLTVYMILNDGSKWWHSFDVTEQVSQAPDPRHVHIIIHGLPLPEPPPENEGAGLIPDVNDWQPVNIDLHM